VQPNGSLLLCRTWRLDDVIQDPVDHVAGIRRCGCCGRDLPQQRLTELRLTPGVYICRGCAIWAARRAHGPTPRQLVQRLRSRRQQRHDVVLSAVPILPSGDLDRAESFYAALGFTTGSRDAGYLVLHHGPAELHFTELEGTPRSAECFIHVNNAVGYWKLLMASQVPGLTPPIEQAHGLTEFTLEDPDGNKIRFGSPA
jgi:catechol 2,3-dioxygenase-like lactoylglutathione lyase family enzyme